MKSTRALRAFCRSTTPSPGRLNAFPQLLRTLTEELGYQRPALVRALLISREASTAQAILPRFVRRHGAMDTTRPTRGPTGRTGCAADRRRGRRCDAPGRLLRALEPTGHHLRRTRPGGDRDRTDSARRATGDIRDVAQRRVGLVTDRLLRTFRRTLLNNA